MNMRHSILSGIHEMVASRGSRRSSRVLEWTKTWICASFFGVFALLIASHASASDYKSYPATSCRMVYGSSGSLGTRPDGSVENDSTNSPTTAICPIVRDNTVTTGAWSVEVHVEDNNDFGAVKCTALSMSPFGGVVSTAFSQTTVNGIGAALLTMAPAQSAEAGYYALRCELPPIGASGRSGINSYVVRETAGSVGVTDRKSYPVMYAEAMSSVLDSPPYIRYDQFGGARPHNPLAFDPWTLPLIRDSVGPDTWWEKSRFRFNDSDGDRLVECLIFSLNEDGNHVPVASNGTQDVAPGPATVEVKVHPNLQQYSGPLSLYCQYLAVDVDAVMYDINELVGD